ncbi:hypothetical protein Tco_1175483 [Tanacetum coccineum]
MVSLISETILKTQEQDTSTPPATPPTNTKKKRAKTLVEKKIKKKNDWKKAVMQRLSNLEQKNHAKIIEESKKTVRDVLKKNPINMFQSSSTPAVTFTEYELKKNLNDMMQNSRSLLDHKKQLDLYNSLINLMDIDESIPQDREGEKRRKRRRKDASESLSKKSKTQEDPLHHERGNEANDLRHEDEVIHGAQTEETLGKDNPKWFQKIAEELPVQNWFNELVDAEEELDEFEYKDGSVTLFGKLVRKIFNKDKMTKEDVEGPAFELLKGTCKDSIELEYNMEQCHLTLTDRIDWTNLEGDRFDHDLSNIGFKSRHEVYSKLNIRSVQSIKDNKQYGYAYQKEIVVTRTDEKEYKFAKADIPNLNQFDNEDLYLLKIQNKICNIKGAEEYDLINALKMYIRKIVIKKRVKDVQIGVESYQTKLNLTKPQLREGCLHRKTLYTILSHPRGVCTKGQ